MLTRRQLLEQVWGWDFFGDERVVDVHIRSIRQALGDPADAPLLVGTVRGVGYRFLGVAEVKRLRRLDVRLFGSYALVVIVVVAALVLTFALRAPTLFADRIRNAGEAGRTETESHQAFASALWSTLADRPRRERGRGGTRRPRSSPGRSFVRSPRCVAPRVVSRPDATTNASRSRPRWSSPRSPAT